MTTTNTNTRCTNRKQEKEKINSHCRDRVHYAVSDTTPRHLLKRGYCSEGLSVVNSCRETPGPIPNPEAKPAHADGTATGRLWESKSPPTPNNNKQQNTETTGKETAKPPSPSFYVLPQQAPHDGTSPHTSSGFRPHGTAHLPGKWQATNPKPLLLPPLSCGVRLWGSLRF